MKEEILKAIEYFKLTTMLNTGLDRQEEHHTALTALQEQLDKLEGAERITAGVGITLRTVCSKCKKQIFNEKYCPNCGAKMKGEQ